MSRSFSTRNKLKRTVVRKSLLSVIFTVSLAFLVQGYLLSTSALLTYNETFVSSFTFDEEREYDSFSLKFVSIFLIGEAIGSLLYIPFGDFLSRRMSMGLFAILTIAMLVCTALAGSIQSLLISRFLLGVSLGPLLCTVPIYIAEISHRSERGGSFSVIYTTMVLGCIVGAIVFLTIHDSSSTEFLPHTAKIQHHGGSAVSDVPASIHRRLHNIHHHHNHPSKSGELEYENLGNENLDNIFSGSARSSASEKASVGDHSKYSEEAFLANIDQIHTVGWRVTCLFPILPLSVFIAALITAPESPRWLLQKGRIEEGQRSLAKLRGSVGIEDELHEMQTGLSNKYDRLGCGDIISDGPLFGRCLLCFLFNIVQPLVGTLILYLFTDEMTDILGMHSSKLVMALGFTGGIVGGVVGYNHLDYWGRRFVMLGGSALMCGSWLFAAGCIMVGDLENGSAEAFETSRVLSFLFGDFYAMFAFAYALSLGPLSIAMPVEMFPFDSRSTAVCVSNFGNFLSSGLFAIYLGLYMQTTDHIAIQHENRKDSGEAEPNRGTSFDDILLGISNVFLSEQQSVGKFKLDDSVTTSIYNGSGVFLSYGLVGFMFLFAGASFFLWLLGYILIPEINGLHLEDIDMFLSDKQRLLRYKKEVKQAMAARKPLLGSDIYEENRYTHGSLRYADMNDSGHSKDSLDKTRRGDDGEEGEFLDTSMRGGHAGFDDSRYAAGRHRGVKSNKSNSVASDPTMYESKNYSRYQDQMERGNRVGKIGNDYESSSSNFGQRDIGRSRRQQEESSPYGGREFAGWVQQVNGSNEASVMQPPPLSRQQQPRYAPSMNTEPPPQPFYPQTLNSGSRRSGSIVGSKGGGGRPGENLGKLKSASATRKGDTDTSGSNNRKPSAFGEFF